MNEETLREMRHHFSSFAALLTLEIGRLKAMGTKTDTLERALFAAGEAFGHADVILGSKSGRLSLFPEVTEFPVPKEMYACLDEEEIVEHVREVHKKIFAFLHEAMEESATKGTSGGSENFDFEDDVPF